MIELIGEIARGLPMTATTDTDTGAAGGKHYFVALIRKCHFWPILRK